MANSPLPSAFNVHQLRVMPQLLWSARRVVNHGPLWLAVDGAAPPSVVPLVLAEHAAVNAMVVAGVIYFLVDKLVYKGNTGVATAE